MLSTASLLARRTGLVRGVATAVAPKLDWAHLQSLVHSDEAKREVGKLKKLFEDTREALAVQSKAPAPINFDHYRKQLPANKDLVDLFEKTQKALKFPPYKGSEEARLAEKMQALSKQALEIEAAAVKRIAELQLELAAVKKESERMATLTVDEVLDSDPKLAAELDKEIKDDKWY
jgi:hypothetical protein